MELRGLNTVVVGMQKSGIAAAEFLAARGAVVRATDLKPLDQLPDVSRLGVPFTLQTPEVFEGSDLIVLSPDVPADLSPLDAARLNRLSVG